MQLLPSASAGGRKKHLPSATANRLSRPGSIGFSISIFFS
jgi:hypothetical protein